MHTATIATPTIDISNPLRQRLRMLAPAAKLAEAEAFIRQFHDENGLEQSACDARLREVRRQLARTNHYDHTADELAFGARIAWRNQSRPRGLASWITLKG